MVDARFGRTVKRLGEILVERRLITPWQLEQALVEQQTTKEFLGTILLRMKLLSPPTLLAALAEQFRLPTASLSVDRVDWQVAKHFPRSALAGGKCFPIRADAESVTVAIANPLDVEALSDIGKAAGFREMHVVLVLEEELRAVLRHYQQQSLRALEEQLKGHGRPPQAH